MLLITKVPNFNIQHLDAGIDLAMSKHEAFGNDSTNIDGVNTVSGPLRPQERRAEQTLEGHASGRSQLRNWVKRRERNAHLRNPHFRHTLRFHLGEAATNIDAELSVFGEEVPTTLDRAVTENDFRFNNPRIDAYNYIGDRVDTVVHHSDYTTAGDIIYGTRIVERLSSLGGLREGMAFYFLANHVGEAGHSCPIICNYETARVLRLVEDFPEREHFIAKLEEPSYTQNFTASQFLTEVQGGSDVGANDTRAWQDSKGRWFIRGEKWFCSNANAELMVISARRSMDRSGTKGLSMFLIPSQKSDGSRNNFTLRRLKEKMGTRALASAEIDFHDAEAIPLGGDFNFMLEKVIHHSRVSLAIAVLGFTSRGLQLAMDFAETRTAFGQRILHYPLVRENLAHIQADLSASLAGTYSLLALQDRIDTGAVTDPEEIAFARLMANIGKSVISKRTVDNMHHCIDAIGGNGAIENTSSLPRLFRDAVIFENWEGTHNTLYMQVLRDIQRYHHDQIYLRKLAQQLEELGHTEGELQQAHAYFAVLKQRLAALHAAVPPLQSLLVQDVVAAMANLYHYVSLVREGTDQRANDGDDSKLACAELFRRKYMADAMPEIPSKDAHYLHLCDRALGLDTPELSATKQVQ
ncbi:MAG: acyl-CoA dehydrogenase family protein [Pseudomonadota bacterium]